jgi:hypothetical protein
VRNGPEARSSVSGYRAIVRASRTADHLVVLLVNYD